MNFEDYSREVKGKWGQTEAYREYAEKTKHYSRGKRDSLIAEMNGIFAKFYSCIADGAAPESPRAQDLVKVLQNHITENYYHCTDGILAGLGQMYVADRRFKNNIDKNGVGTAEFVSKAIKVYCKR